MAQAGVDRFQAGAVADWLGWGLDEAVLTEPIPGTGRVALWLAAPEVGGRHWERLWLAEQTGFLAGTHIRAAAAMSVRVRQQAGGLLARLFRRRADQSWVLPNGQTAEQLGERRTDLLLVWAEDEAASLEEAWVKSRWPKADRVQRVGKNLYLVSGVASPASAEPVPAGRASGTGPELPPPAEDPRLEAERLVEAARASGDRRQEASALADLGALYLHQGKAEPAIAALGQALALARELGDLPRQADALGNLGLLTMIAGHPGRALEIFGMALPITRETADRYAEKTALERMGLAHARLNQPAEAAAAFAEALTLARALGHRKHEADLLWDLAIANAELGRRDQALAEGQAAITLMEQVHNPQAAVFAEHLRKYQVGETSAGLIGGPEASSAGAAAYLGGSVEANLWASPPGAAAESAPVEGPGLLRMALSAAKSMAKFVGSGFKTAPQQTLQQRLQTCAACDHHTGLRGRLCGCFTAAKARLAHEECPIGKW